MKFGQNRHISILTIDINMPGMDGHEPAELARRIRSELKMLQPHGREPPARRTADDQEAVLVRGTR